MSKFIGSTSALSVKFIESPLKWFIANIVSWQGTDCWGVIIDWADDPIIECSKLATGPIIKESIYYLKIFNLIMSSLGRKKSTSPIRILRWAIPDWWEASTAMLANWGADISNDCWGNEADL